MLNILDNNYDAHDSQKIVHLWYLFEFLIKNPVDKFFLLCSSDVHMYMYVVHSI